MALPSSPPAESRSTLSVVPSRVLALLLGGIALLVIAQVTMLVGRFGFGHDAMLGFSSLVAMNQEANAPTWYSSFLLLAAAAALALTWREERIRGARFQRSWAILSFVFLALALDEGIALRERLVWPLQAHVEGLAVVRHAWVVPYAGAALALAIVYIPFLRALPRATARLFVIAGAMYVGGAAGMEVVGGYVNHSTDLGPLAYSICVTIEEVLEMAGVAVFIYAVLDRLAARGANLELRFTRRKES